jgi:hypothetical protein
MALGPRRELASRFQQLGDHVLKVLHPIPIAFRCAEHNSIGDALSVRYWTQRSRRDPERVWPGPWHPRNIVPYFGGCSSLLSQPNTLSVFRGSGRSQSKHWSVRFPFPSEGSAKTRGAPHVGQVGRSASPMEQFMSANL